MKNKIVFSVLLLSAVWFLSGCNELQKSENMLSAESSFAEAKTAGAADLAPTEFYQAEKQFNGYLAARKEMKYIDADSFAALAGYLSETALARADIKRRENAIRESELATLKSEKEIMTVENNIKDLQLKAKDMTIEERNKLIKDREQKLSDVNGQYRQLYDTKMKAEETSLRNIEDLSLEISAMQKQLDLSQSDLSKLSIEDQARRKLALDQIAVLNKRFQDERDRTSLLQQENETLATKVDAEQLKNKAVLAIGNAALMKAKAESMGAKEGALAIYSKGETSLADARKKMVTGTFLEAYVLAVTAGNFYNDAITSANGRYLEETERLRKAREEIKAVFRGLDDTEITDEKGRVKIIMRGALFEYNKSALLERFHQRLDKLAEILVRYNEFPISVEGHTDNIGADTYNLKLSSERSGAISTYLIDNGKLDGKRIVALGYGKSRPIASNDTADGRALNRRVEIILQRNFTAGDKL